MLPDENGFMKYSRLLVALPIYAVLYTLSLAVAFGLRFDLQISGEPLAEFITWLPMVVAIKISLFVAAREWRRRHRYTSLSDVVYVAAVSLIASTIIYLLNAMGAIDPGLHRSIILIDASRSPFPVACEELTMARFLSGREATANGGDR